MAATSPDLNKPLRTLEQARADLAAARAPRLRFYVRFDDASGDDDVVSEWATDPATAYEQFRARAANVRARNINVDPVPDAILLRDGIVAAIDRADGLKIMLAQSADATRAVA